MLKFALAGNPNCGKTTLFNSLTGSTAYVGNWPGVTVEKRGGTYKNKKTGESVEIIDLPGIYSLSPYTPEEVISRNFILQEKPDCIINVVDATNLERNLYMTTQIIEMDVPVVVALNMSDALIKNGQKINVEFLEKALGVKVVSISALKNENLTSLMDEAIKAAKSPREGKSILPFGVVDKAEGIYKNNQIENPLFHATKALENDEIEVKANKDEAREVSELVSSETNKNDYEAKIADERYKWISANCTPALIGRPTEEKNKLSTSDKIDKVLTNKWAGILIFLVILFVIFHITFATDLFYLHAAGVQFSNFDEGGMFEGLFYSTDGIASIGTFLANFLTALTDAFTAWISSLLEGTGWVQGFICDGVLGGLFAVIGFLPQILVLFFFFSILEDSGYMARVAFILDRIFRKFGLSGRAFLPMIMGFGCGVPAMINTRTLNTDKERIQTIRVIPFFACSAKLPIIVSVAGGIFTQLHYGNPDVITFLMYLLGMVTAIIMVLLMHKTTQREKVPPFIMELPSYHMPQPHALGIHLWDKTKHFVKKAFTVILATTILIWFLQHFAWNWSYLEDDAISESILASIGMLIQPIFTPLGFGSQLNSNGWVFGVAAITGLLAKESVIGTFGTLAGALGTPASDAAAVAVMIRATGIGYPGLLTFIAFNMLTIPCFASVATAKAELPKGQLKWTILFWMGTSYVVACMVYLAFTWLWTIPIIIAVIAGLFVIAYFYDKRKTAEEQSVKKGA